MFDVLLSIGTGVCPGNGEEALSLSLAAWNQISQSILPRSLSFNADLSSFYVLAVMCSG